MPVGYTPQWISLLDAIEHVRLVSGGTIEEAWRALEVPLREGVILGRFRGQEVGGIETAYLSVGGAVPHRWWYAASVFGDGSVEFGNDRLFGRPPPRREIEIQRSDLLQIWLAPEAPIPAEAVNVKKRRRGPAPGALDRYSAADRKLYTEVERIMRDEKLSVSAAALRLAEDGKLAGTGTSTPQSRARRLAERYRRERRN
jgi:hypothetical protein